MNIKLLPHSMHISHTEHPDMSGLMARFIAYIDARPATAATYNRALRQFFKYLITQDITEPSREDIIAYRESLKATGHKPATIATYMISIRRFFNWTEVEGIYPNVSAGIKGAKVDRSHKKDPLTSRQIRQVFSLIDRSTPAGVRDYALLAVMTCGGLRTIEVVRANVSDLRVLGDNTVLYIQGKGKDEKNDYMKIPEATEKALRDYLTMRGGADASEPLFAGISNNNGGERLTTRSVSRIVKQRLIKAGYDSDRLTAHSLRHTAATLNMVHGGTLDETQQLLRHSKIDTTMIYTHHLERAKNKSEERIEAVMFNQ